MSSVHWIDEYDINGNFVGKVFISDTIDLTKYKEIIVPLKVELLDGFSSSLSRILNEACLAEEITRGLL